MRNAKKILTQPLRQKVFELAFRLGIRPYQLMQEMSMPELLDCIEYDQCVYTDSWLQHAVLCSKIDAAMWTKGRPKPDYRNYLPKVKAAKRRRKSLAEIRSMFNSVAANSGGLKRG